MNVNTVDSIMNKMPSLSKEKYFKNELLPEYLSLQEDMARIIFKGVSNPKGTEYRLKDIENHFINKNDRSHIADAELEAFLKDSDYLANRIRAEISGNKGEDKAASYLNDVKEKIIILRNVELTEDDERTEIDFLVISRKCVSIIEVKNTSRDVLVDKNGDYYRTGKYLTFDSAIGQKMAKKEKLVKNVLNSIGLDRIPVKSIITFTTSRKIQVTNECEWLNTCYAKHLQYQLSKLGECDVISREEMNMIEKAIENGRCHEAYPVDFDVKKIKTDFARLFIKLNSESSKPERECVIRKEVPTKKIFELYKRFCYQVVIMIANFSRSFIKTIKAGV